jgi:hypothetical protein
VANTWTPTREFKALVYRRPVVSTGTDMIVWGGGFSSTSGGGERCGLLGDTWTDMTLVDAPMARRNHTLLWAGSEMIVWGGQAQNATTYLNLGGRYLP